jgi:antitoxin ParD1/3/4
MSRQATLNVSLTPTLDGFVRAKVKSGAYESASEVIRESLRLFQAVEKHEQSFWSDVREKVAVARRQIADGKVVDGEEAMDAILTELGNEPVPKRKTRGRR